MKCHICNSKDVKFVLTIDSAWGIYGCDICDTQFVDPLPSSQALGQWNGASKYYDGLYNPMYGWLTFCRQWGVLKNILRKNGGRILDFGCGGGQFLDKISSEKWEKYGIDKSIIATSIARTKGIQAFNTLEQVDFKDEFFDVVVMFATIEHLPNPNEVLVELNRVLKKGGLFAIMTGDVTSRKAKAKAEKWHMYSPPEHLFFFSAKSIDYMMDELGFVKVKSLFTDGGMYGIPFLDAFYPILKWLPLFDHYYGYYIKGAINDKAFTT